jgi:hypothetical protein
MKYLILLFSLAIFAFHACSKDEEPPSTCEHCEFTCLDTIDSDVITNDCLPNWECSFAVHSQSRVDINEFHGLASGDKNVFLLYNYTEGDPGIADDETAISLVFELDKSQNSFTAKDNDLKLMQVHFQRFCYCSEVDFKQVSLGCIQGERQSDGTWFIQGNLFIFYSFGEIHLKFYTQFKS